MSNIVYTFTKGVRTRTAHFLVLGNGRCPIEDWLGELRDVSLVSAVITRIARLRNGNFGDHKSVGAGVFELRISKGPGLRVYTYHARELRISPGHRRDKYRFRP